MFNLDNIYNVDCYEAIKLIPSKSVDLIITDPIQAGVIAVMSVADTAVFNIKKLGDNIKY